MDHGKYELEMAYRKMAEYQQQAEHNKVVKKLKKFNRSQKISFWRRIIAFSFTRLSKGQAKFIVTPVISNEVSLGASDKK